ncbi:MULTISPECIES: hypothetical protein [Ensifer]|uniref:Transposase n=1 Tax=Ensifer canadensis TaxID=555315 RepID=A0AAW4FXI2_9HYPH|nr:hypothetical protein [Ensifer canadensis]MBM3095973.1 hypothetical protein [Ensifer canadensis]
MMEEGQKLVVRLVGRNGRGRFDPASKDRLIAACLEPRASVSVECNDVDALAAIIGALGHVQARR